MTECTFYRIDNNKLLCQLRMEHPPAKGDTIILPSEGLQQWRVEHREWRPAAVDRILPREEVDVWVSRV